MLASVIILLRHNRIMKKVLSTSGLPPIILFCVDLFNAVRYIQKCGKYKLNKS